MSRKTQQRRWIRHVFEAIRRPLSPQEVLESAQQHVKGLGIATVYRNLKTLNEDGWLRAVEIPGEPTRYELAGLDYHHYFHCDDCGRVYDVPGCPGDLSGIIPRELNVNRHQVLLFGQCAACVETGEPMVQAAAV